MLGHCYSVFDLVKLFFEGPIFVVQALSYARYPLVSQWAVYWVELNFIFVHKCLFFVLVVNFVRTRHCNSVVKELLSSCRAFEFMFLYILDDFFNLWIALFNHYYEFLQLPGANIYLFECLISLGSTLILVSLEPLDPVGFNYIHQCQYSVANSVDIVIVIFILRVRLSVKSN